MGGMAIVRLYAMNAVMGRLMRLLELDSSIGVSSIGIRRFS